MYNVNFNISGDLHIHLGDSDLDRLFPDEIAEEDDNASLTVPAKRKTSTF